MTQSVHHDYVKIEGIYLGYMRFTGNMYTAKIGSLIVGCGKSHPVNDLGLIEGNVTNVTVIAYDKYLNLVQVNSN